VADGVAHEAGNVVDVEPSQPRFIMKPWGMGWSGFSTGKAQRLKAKTQKQKPKMRMVSRRRDGRGVLAVSEVEADRQCLSWFS